MLTFLQINGVAPTGEPDLWIAFIYEHLSAGTFRKDTLEAWLHAHTEPFDPLA
jgi:death-on-curing protein